MDGLSKVVDLLKASGWQCLMLSAAAWSFIWASRAGHVPPLEGSWLLIAYVFAFGTAALALAAAGAQLQRLGVFLIGVWKAWYLKRAAQRRFRKQIDFLDEHERQIFGYLLHYKRKAFGAAMDGGYASKLIAQGFIVRIGQAGQVFDAEDMPLKVPEYIWEVLEETGEQFPHRPQYAEGNRHGRDRTEVQPWRVPWMAR